MGLYINNKHQPNVFKNKSELKEPNQSYSRQDFLTNLMNEQSKANSSLKKAMTDLRLQTLQQEEMNSNQWAQVEQNLQVLQSNNEQQKEFEEQLMEILETLQQENTELQTTLENEVLDKKQMLEELNHLRKSYEEIAARLTQNEEVNEQLTLQMAEQLELQKETVQSVNNQEVVQKEVLNRLDSQEALVEKISRQITQIRSILFERTNFLAAKIEDGYKVTSSYVYKLMTGSDKPLTFYLMNQGHKEENEKGTDK